VLANVLTAIIKIKHTYINSMNQEFQYSIKLTIIWLSNNIQLKSRKRPGGVATLHWSLMRQRARRRKVKVNY